MAPKSKAINAAFKWLQSTGHIVEWTTAQDEEGGPEFSIIRVKVPSHPIMIRDVGHALQILSIAEFPAAMMEKIFGKASASDLQTAWTLLRTVLLSNPRTGFAISPESPQSIDAVRRVSQVQLVVFEETDRGSVNRLLDALQELSTGFVRLQAYLAAYAHPPEGGISGEQQYSPAKSAPGIGYA